jgi:hypothetical protein
LFALRKVACVVIVTCGICLAVLGGIVLLQSLGGGTGSGFGTRLSQCLAAEYPGAVMCSLVSPYHFGEVIVQHYNSLMTLAYASQEASCAVFDNEIAKQLCMKMMHVKNPTMAHINKCVLPQRRKCVCVRQSARAHNMQCVMQGDCDSAGFLPASEAGQSGSTDVAESRACASDTQSGEGVEGIVFMLNRSNDTNFIIFCCGCCDAAVPVLRCAIHSAVSTVHRHVHVRQLGGDCPHFAQHVCLRRGCGM